MQRKKNIYESPDMTEIRVELESSICAGSVDFKGETTDGVAIKDQKVVEMGTTNDWSNEAWITETPKGN